ncbi:MAG: LysR family transcriptional regulator [Solirubrobacteraceae bacterium]
MIAGRPPLDLRLLTAYVALADEGHFGRTARRLYMSPSALSQQIKSLETAWGVTLFTRGARGATLTPEGARLLSGARRVVAGAAAYREEVEAIADGSTGTWRLGFTDQVLGGTLTELLRSFRDQLAHVRVVTHSHRTSADALQRLQMGLHDAVVVVDPPADGGLSSVTLATVPYVVAVSAAHPLAGSGAVAWAVVLEHLDRIVIPESSDPGLIALPVDGERTSLGSPSGRVADAILSAARGDGAALVTTLSAERFRVPGVEYRTVTGDDAPQAAVALTWRSDNTNPLLTDVVAVAGPGQSLRCSAVARELMNRITSV